MRRRKITTDKKDIPPIEVVRATMLVGQKMYKLKLHTPNTTWNMDETAIQWGLDPLFVYIPPDQARGATAGSSKEKERITAAVCVDGGGSICSSLYDSEAKWCKTKSTKYASFEKIT